MSLQAYLSILLVLAGQARAGDSDSGTGSQSPEQTLSSDQPRSGDTRSDEERLRTFLSQHANKSLNLNQIRQDQTFGKITADSYCSLEESIMPATLQRGKYLSHTFSYQVYSDLIIEFSKFLEHNMLTLQTKHLARDPHSGAFYTDSPHNCGHSLLGLEALEPSELLENEITLLACSIIELTRGEVKEKHCICRSPNIGLTSDLCLSMLTNLAKQYKVTNEISSLENLESYPSFIAMSNSKMFVLKEGQILTCVDSDLKINFLELFMSYQRLTNQIERISSIFNLTMPVLLCQHDLVTLSFEEMKEFILCVQQHKPNSRQKRDLLSALGLRTDVQSFVTSANAAIKTNFELVQRNEEQIISQLKLETAAIQRFINQETSNSDTLALQISYLQSIYASSDRTRHHRSMLVSSLDSLTFSFSQLSLELDQIIALALSVLRQEKVICLSGECIEVKSLLLKRNAASIQITAREARVATETVYRLSCRLFPLGLGFYVHYLNDAALLKFNNKYVDRATKVIVRPECMTAHRNCPGPPEAVQPRHLIGSNLYLSIHNGVIECQCLKNTTVTMISKNITCTATDPQPVTLPFLIDNKLIENLHTHYFIAGQREQQALSHQELESLKHESTLPLFTFDDIFSQLKKDPWNFKSSTTALSAITAACFILVIILCVGGCFCPTALTAALGLVAHCLLLIGKGITYLFSQCYERTVSRWRPGPGQAPAPSAPHRSNTLNLNDPAARPHLNEEELARLRGSSNDMQAAASAMINASQPAGPYPGLFRQNAFSSKLINGQQVLTGSAGAFESLVSYDPRRHNPVNIATSFPEFRQSCQNQFHQNPDTSRSNQSRQETLSRLSEGFNPK